MDVREPTRAGSFYPAGPEACRRQAHELFEQVVLPGDLPTPMYGGIVPHAGWTFSGRLASMTFKALLERNEPAPQTVVLFGADHAGTSEIGEVWTGEAWRTPVGDLGVDTELADELAAVGDVLRANPAAHRYEHSIEVQMPLLAELRPKLRVVPIEVPPTESALDVGRAVAERISERPTGSVVVVGSSDLTHHGGHFGSPGGHGPQSEAYARNNDQRMIQRIETLDAKGVLVEANEHRNACGGGAIAATIAAVRGLGATSARLLEYTNSYQVIRQLQPSAADDTTVGYAAMVFI